MPPSDQTGSDPTDRRVLGCSGCGWDIECPAADAMRYTRTGCPACGAPVVAAAPGPEAPGRNKRLVRRRTVRGGVRAEVRRGMTGLGKDLAAGLADLSEDGLGVVVKTRLDPKEECEVVLIRAAGGKPLKVHAEVRWCRPAGDGTFRVGLRFRQRLARTDLLDLTR